MTARAPNTALLAALLVSLLAHASPQLPRLARTLEAEPATLASWSPGSPAGRIDFRAARIQLVARARKDRQEHDLALGTFLLDAAAIDAGEAKIPLDRERAGKEYDRRLRALRAALPHAPDIQSAFARTFGDMHYRGIAGGTMAEALLEGGGSCEPLSHLLAAALHDAGYAEHAYIRRYGGGVPHLAPIYLFRASEHDLVAGGPAFPGGLRFAAADLVEIYAIAHGLPGKLETWRGPPPPRGVTEPPPDPPASALSLSRGYPPNADRFPGNVPLYAERALASSGGGATLDTSTPWPCTSSGSSLFRARVAMLASEPYEIELFELPSRRRLSDLAHGASRWEAEDLSKKSAAERLVWHACLALVYEELADGFAARSLTKLGAIAADKAERWRRATIALTEASAPKQLARTLVAVDDAWMLLAIEQGDAFLFAAAHSTTKNNDIERVEIYTALLAHARTRARAHEEVAALGFFEQWLIAGALSFLGDGRGHPAIAPVHLGDATEFARGYRLFSTLEEQLVALAEKPNADRRSALVRLVRGRVGPGWARGVREAFLQN